MLKKEGWNPKDFDNLNEMGEFGWEAFSVARLNDTQFLVFMKFAAPSDVGETDVDQEFMQGMVSTAERIFQ